MNKIKCPKCGEVFTIDEDSYASIVSQIKNKEFEEELARREKEISTRNKLSSELAVNNALKEKEEEIAKFKETINKLTNELNSQEKISKLNEENLKQKYEAEYKSKLLDKDNQIRNATSEKEIAVNKAISEKELEISKKDKEIIELSSRLDSAKKDAELSLSTMKEKHSLELKSKETEIEYYKDLKVKMSTKLLGETLEQHCQIAFNQIRMTAFPKAYFEKDNAVSTESGSKGDFIFKDFIDDTDVPFISIMFEMKNENDTTSTKHKNEHFFAELDKDRREKGCEYAVLVSMLESDNELYNGGIVDVSYKYPKMYVVRPQCFIPIITLLRNAALNSIDYQKQLIEYKNENIDIERFQENFLEFRDKFNKNYTLAQDRFQKAIEEIDKTIDHLNKVRDGLIGADRNYRLANDKIQDLSIKKLAKDSPSLKDKFDNK